VTGVGGGAWYPPAQASLADKTTTRHSYFVPLSGYLAMTCYAVGMVINQAVNESFRFRNIDEIADRKEKVKSGELEKQDVQRSPTAGSIEKDKSSDGSIQVS